MRRVLLTIALLSLVCLLPCDQAAAAITTQEIAVTPDGIRIQLQERTLGEVLRHIQKMSGVRFSLPRSMDTTPITTTVHAPDWSSAVRELLRPFSTAEVWDKQELSRVYILERGTAASISERSVDVSKGDNDRPEGAGMPEPPSAASLPPPPLAPPPPPFQQSQ